MMPRFSVWMTAVMLAQLAEIQEFEAEGRLRKEMKTELGL